MISRATQLKVIAVLSGILCAVPAFLRGQMGQVQNQQRQLQVGIPEQGNPATPLRLEDLERMAMDNNPTLKQAEANIRAAQGKRKQAGLYPNPTVGYNGEEISRGPIIRGGEHGFFVDQTIVTAGKLGKARKIFDHAVLQAEAEAEAQRYRVLNTVRKFYYQALAAQRRVELRQRLAALAEEAVQTSHGLFNVGQADRPDVLEAEIEAQQMQLALEKEKNEQLRIWQQLASTVGISSFTPVPLAGDFDGSLPDINPDAALAEILRSSPETKLAQVGVQRAQAALKLARAERIPDILARGGLRYNRELLELDRKPVGWEGFADVGVKIPLFNRNQGNIAAAQSEILFAEQEMCRLELSLRARFSQAFTRYLTARRIAETYKRELIPRAEQAYQMYLTKFKEMGAAYPQVLIAQRTLFQLSAEYVSAVEDFWDTVIPLRGFLLMDGIGAPRSFVESTSKLEPRADTSEINERRDQLQSERGEERRGR